MWIGRRSCFAVIGQEDQANNNSNSPSSCADPFCQSSPSELFDWQVSYLDIYLFYVYGRYVQRQSAMSGYQVLLARHMDDRTVSLPGLLAQPSNAYPSLHQYDTTARKSLRVELNCVSDQYGSGGQNTTATTTTTAQYRRHHVTTRAQFSENLKMFLRSSSAPPNFVLTYSVQLKAGHSQWRFHAGAGGNRCPPNRGQPPHLARSPNCGQAPKFSRTLDTLWSIDSQKNYKFDATRCQIFRLRCTKFYFRWGSAPDSIRGAYSTPPDLLAVFKGAYF